MYQNKKILAIIPARSGSKRVKNKNILELNGKPLISWSIESASKSRYIDEVMVSTDDEKIKLISQKFGAKTPFLRPKEISRDNTTKDEVIKHTLEFYKNNLLMEFDYLIYLQPTSPLRDEMHIDKAIEFLFNKNAEAVVSVCEVEHPIQWTGIIPPSKDMSLFLQNIPTNIRSQDLEKYYRLNGAIFICKVESFCKVESVFLNNKIFAFEMDKDVSIDIDTEIDFKYAEFLFSCTNEKELR